MPGSAAATKCAPEGKAAGNQGAAADRGASLLAQVEQLRHKLHAGHTVDDGMVDLGDQTDPATFDPLDDVHLPRRLIRIERMAHDLGHQGGQLGVTSGSGQRHPMKVVIEVEVGIIDPPWMIEPEGDGHEASTEGDESRDTIGQHVSDRLERVTTRRRVGVEDAGICHFHGCDRRLRVDEHRIEAAHSLHIGLLRSC